MGVINLDEHRPHINISMDNGNVHVIPLQTFYDIVERKISITDIDDLDEIAPVIIGEWLERFPIE